MPGHVSILRRGWAMPPAWLLLPSLLYFPDSARKSSGSGSKGSSGPAALPCPSAGFYYPLPLLFPPHFSANPGGLFLTQAYGYIHLQQIWHLCPCPLPVKKQFLLPKREWLGILRAWTRMGLLSSISLMGLKIILPTRPVFSGTTYSFLQSHKNLQTASDPIFRIWKSRIPYKTCEFTTYSLYATKRTDCIIVSHHI